MREEAKVEPVRLLARFEQIVPKLYRYPALDTASLRQKVEEFVSATDAYGSLAQRSVA